MLVFATVAFVHHTPTSQPVSNNARMGRSFSENSTRTRLDALSDSAIENVVRYLSDTPRSKNWHANFPSSRLVTLLKLGEVVSDATGTASRELTLDEIFFCDVACNENERQRLVFMEVAALGDKLRRLDLKYLVDGVTLTVTKCCTALRNLTLSIHSPSELASFSDFFNERGSMLEVLDIHFAILSKPELSIVLKCTAL